MRPARRNARQDARALQLARRAAFGRTDEARARAEAMLSALRPPAPVAPPSPPPAPETRRRPDRPPEAALRTLPGPARELLGRLAPNESLPWGDLPDPGVYRRLLRADCARGDSYGLRLTEFGGRVLAILRAILPKKRPPRRGSPA